MQLRSLALAAICVLASISVTAAQVVSDMDEATMRQHIEHKAEPVYPAIAKAARVQGTVVLSVQVNTSGKPETITVLSGPPMLRRAAIDAVHQWIFQPFVQNGKAVATKGQISIAFDLGKDAPTPDEEKTAQEYFPVSNECIKLASQHTDVAKAADTCNHAAQIAAQFASDRRFIEKRSSFTWAAWAAAYNNDFSTSLSWAKKAVEVVRLGHDDNSGSNAAYTVLALAEAKTGDLASADKDFTTAEDFGRKAIAWAKQVGFEHGDSYSRSLNQDLRMHAQVLQALNHPEEAQKKLDEATKLQ
jgi:TonB family protein